MRTADRNNASIEWSVARYSTTEILLENDESTDGPHVAITDVWGTGENNVYAIFANWIYRFDGSTATCVAQAPHRLNAIDGSGPSDIYAVGDYGTVLHYDGRDWRMLPAPEKMHLQDVSNPAPGAVFIAGHDGRIHQRHGKGWRASLVMLQPVRSIWMPTASEGFAVAGGTVLRFDGTSWSALSHLGRVFRVWGTSSSNVYVWGNDGAFRYDGTEFRREESIDRRFRPNMIFGHSATEVYAISLGGYCDRSSGAVGPKTLYRFDGACWSPVVWDFGTVPRWFHAICSTADASFFVGGPGYAAYVRGTTVVPVTHSPDLSAVAPVSSSSAIVAGNHGFIGRFDFEHSKGRLSSLPSPAAGEINALWAANEHDIFAAVVFDGIFRYQEGTWHRTFDMGIRSITGFWGTSAEDVFAVGIDGVVLHFDGRAWTEMQSPTKASLYGVFGSGSNDVYAVGDGGTIIHYDGQVWSMMATTSTADFRAGWASATSAIAVGSRRDTMDDQVAAAHVLVNGSWVDLGSAPFPCAYLKGAWGTDAGEFHIIGSHGRVARYDGRRLVEDSGVQSGSVEAAQLLDGRVFAVGESGEVRVGTVLSRPRLERPR